jgi:hypothetical protein
VTATRHPHRARQAARRPAQVTMRAWPTTGRSTPIPKSCSATHMAADHRGGYFTRMAR